MVEVVEHEHERLLAPLERVGQLDERGGGDVVERERDRGHEPIGVVVGLVDGEPRDRPRILLEPVLEQRRLAVPRGRDEQRERHVGRLREAAQQPLAPHVPSRTRGRWRRRSVDPSSSANSRADPSVI